MKQSFVRLAIVLFALFAFPMFAAAQTELVTTVGAGGLAAPQTVALIPGGGFWAGDCCSVIKFDANSNRLFRIGAGYHGAPGLIGTAGNAPGQFNLVTALTVDSTGSLYVMDSRNRRVQKFDSGGAFLYELRGIPGVRRFSTLYGVKTDSSDHVYISSDLGLYEFDSAGHYIRLVPLSFLSPSAFAIDRSGNFYVGVRNHNIISIYNRDGKLLSSFSTFANRNYRDIVLLPNNNIVALDLYSLGLYNSAGRFLAQANSGQAFNLAADNSGTIYITYGGVYKLNSNLSDAGLYAATTNDNGLVYYASSIAFDGTGSLYVLDPTRYLVQKFDASGHFLLQFGSKGTGAGQWGKNPVLAAGGQGQAYVGDFDTGRVEKFDANGNFVAFIGGAKLNTFKDIINIATDPAGNLYVLNKGYTYDGVVVNFYARITKFDSGGRQVSQYDTQTLPAGTQPQLGFAADSSGNVYLLDPSSKILTRCDSTGSPTGRIDLTLQSGRVTDVSGNPMPDSAGNIYVFVNSLDGYDTKLWKFDANFNLLAKLPISRSIGAIDSNGRFAVPYNSGVLLYRGTNSVSGTIQLDSIPSFYSVQNTFPGIDVEFRAPGSTVPLYISHVSITPNNPNYAQASLSIFGVPAGAYDVALKSGSILRRVIPNVIVNGAATLPDVMLQSGDANGDNRVDIADFGLLVSSFEADPALVDGGYDVRADFNYDGVVDIADFGVLVNNYNISGE